MEDSVLKCEQKVLATLSANHVTALIGYKPTGVNLARAHIATLVILDTGVRASELLGLTKDAVDFDNLVLKVAGKGGNIGWYPSPRSCENLFIALLLGAPIPRITFRYQIQNEGHRSELGTGFQNTREATLHHGHQIFPAHAETHHGGQLASSRWGSVYAVACSWA
jgi:integrase